jgi:hypothetical protein
MGQAAIDAFAMALNVSSSVFIVFVNKVLLDTKTGYGFTFGTIATAPESCT